MSARLARGIAQVVSVLGLAVFAAVGCGMENSLVGGIGRERASGTGGTSGSAGGSGTSGGASGASGGASGTSGGASGTSGGASGTSGGASGTSGGTSGTSGGTSGTSGGTSGTTGSDGGSGIVCPVPRVACSGECVDLSTDEDNCGACGLVCPSGICRAGRCVGSTPGDVVFIGHDYSGEVPQAQTRALANAVFISGENPLRILSYEGASDAVSVSAVHGIVADRATAMGRSIVFTSTRVPADLAAKDLAKRYHVVLVHDAPELDGGGAATIGASWASPLENFAKVGGVVVVLDGGSGFGSMPALVAASRLLPVTSHHGVAPETGRVTVSDVSDVVAKQVVSPYAAGVRTVAFGVSAPASATLAYVAREGEGAALGDPVILHRVVE